jgi:large subunit ribosomal protein L24
MMMNTETIQNKRIRKGDNVVVMSGNDRGLTGVVLSRTVDRAVIQGVNMRKKHTKKSQTHPNGGILSIERPIHVSKLKLLNAEGKAVKARVRVNSEGNREIYTREGDQEVVLRSTKSK